MKITSQKIDCKPDETLLITIGSDECRPTYDDVRYNQKLFSEYFDNVLVSHYKNGEILVDEKCELHTFNDADYQWIEELASVCKDGEIYLIKIWNYMLFNYIYNDIVNQHINSKLIICYKDIKINHIATENTEKIKKLFEIKETIDRIYINFQSELKKITMKL